jgi:outer membrane protein
VDLTGNYYLKRPDGYLSDVEWDVEFRLTLPIYEGGTRVSQTREAVLRRKEAELELHRLRRQAASNIRTLYEGLKLRQAQLTALKRSSQLAQKNYEVLQSDERRGLTRNIDVQLGLTEYRLSQRRYDQARYTIRLELIRLHTAAAIWPELLADAMAPTTAMAPTVTKMKTPTKAAQ